MMYHLPPYFVTDLALEETVDWGVRFCGVGNAWAKTKGRGVKVAVLDTGVDAKHEDLSGQIDELRDFTGSGEEDRNGHGTHVCGIIAAKANGVGVVGVAPESRLVVGKVLGNDGAGSSEWIARGIEWAASAGAKIISMSLGSSSRDSRIHDAIKAVVSSGVIVVAAAGNSGPGTVNYPGAYPEVVCVGAIDALGRVAGFSSTNQEVDVVGPGVNVYSTIPGNRYAKMSGTSMATPFVAGVLALMVSEAPVKPHDVLRMLSWSSADAGKSGFDPEYGWGIIHASALVSGVAPLPSRVKNVRDDKKNQANR